jgi:hypothetical protein
MLKCQVVQNVQKQVILPELIAFCCQYFKTFFFVIVIELKRGNFLTNSNILPM